MPQKDERAILVVLKPRRLPQNKISLFSCALKVFSFRSCVSLDRRPAVRRLGPRGAEDGVPPKRRGSLPALTVGRLMCVSGSERPRYSSVSARIRLYSPSAKFELRATAHFSPDGPKKSILQWPFGGCLSALVVLLAHGKRGMGPK